MKTSNEISTKRKKTLIFILLNAIILQLITYKHPSILSSIDFYINKKENQEQKKRKILKTVSKEDQKINCTDKARIGG